ncbi:MAG: hypothetical protein K6T88_03090 [Bacillus sp. (in: Bacteria)]|nr:hypothetical protein [Bacillus sp. (in: firmicutes)]
MNVFRVDKFLPISFLMVLPIEEVGEDAQNPYQRIKKLLSLAPQGIPKLKMTVF